jgi:hypothetical protein
MLDQDLDRDRERDTPSQASDDLEVELDAGAFDRSKSFLARETGVAARAKATDATPRDSEVSPALVGTMMRSPTIGLPHGDSYGGGASEVVAHGGPALREEMAGAGIEGLTYGNHVAFSSAAPAPDVVQHELAHVAQQTGPGAGSRAADEAGATAAESMPAPAIADALAGGAPAPVARAKKGDAKGPKRPRGFELASGRPAGEVVGAVKIKLDDLAPDLRAGIAGEPLHVEITLLVEDEHAIVHVATGDEDWVARASARDVAGALFGPLAEEVIAALGTTTEVLRRLLKGAPRATQRVRVDLGDLGAAGQPSFVIFDLEKIASGLGRGSASGFRPVEAQLLLGQAGGLKVFADEEVKQADLPGGSPIGDWFEIPDDGTIRKVLGAEGKGTVACGVFYEGGVLSVAVKPDAAATTGIAAHINLAYLLEKLKSLGGKALDFLDKLLAKLRAGGARLFDVIGGLLTFDLPDLGGFLEFDFKLQLPRLFKGGGGWGFSLAGLWPSAFSFDLGGGISFGALPRMRFPWLKMPKLGSFQVPFGKLEGLIGELPGLPTLPSFGLDLHFAGDLSLGLSIDLSKLWPDFGGGDSVFGFQFDLAPLLEKLAGAGQWLLDKLRAVKNWYQRYIHLGSDGVLRIYDARDDRALIGFHLVRLLDGADATDLAPTELRWTHGKDGKDGKPGFSFEVGEAAPDDGSKPGGPKDKVSPTKPPGTEVFGGSVAAPESLTTTLALDKGSHVDASVIWDAKGETVTIWASAPSDVYDGGQSIKMTARYTAIAEAIAKKIPEGKRPRGRDLPIELDPSGTVPGVRFKVGRPPDKAGAAAEAGSVSGHVFWKLERLLGASDWAALVPDEMVLNVEGAAGVQLGKIETDVPLIADRFAVSSQPLRQQLLLAGDAPASQVWAGLHYDGDVVGLSLTKTQGGDEGAYAHVHLSFLLRQLERLGQLGKALLEKLASFSMGPAKPGSNPFDRIGDIVAALFARLRNAVGKLEFDLGGTNFLRWDFQASLPRMGLDLDFSKLIPEFSFELPQIDGLSMSFLRSIELGNPLAGFSIDLGDLGKLKKLLEGIPSFDLKSLVPKVNINWEGPDLGLWLELGNLFGDGDRAFGFRIPMATLLARLQKLGGWFGGKLKDVAELRKYIHVGSDGILRVYEAKDGNRVGFDLRRLFDGADLADLVPVELHLEVEGKQGQALASVAYGDRKVSEQDEALAISDGKVNVPAPTTPLIARASPKAPAFLADYFGAPKGAVIPLSLHSDLKTADLYATMPSSDRAVNVHLNVQNIASAVEKAGPLRAPEGKTVAIDKKRSKEKGALVVTFGVEKKPDQELGKGEYSGYLAWKLDTLVAGEGLEKLVPDELHIENDKGALTAGTSLPLKGMAKRVDFPVPQWAQAAVGATTGEVWTNDLASSKQDLRVALVEGGEDGRANARGIEVGLKREFVDKVEERLQKLANDAQGKVGKALKRARGAGHDVGETLTKKNISLAATTRGVRVQRGKEGDADHIYATFGWENFMNLANGKAEPTDLIPDEFRVATKAVSLEVQDLPTGMEGVNPPEGSRQIGTMHALLREPLTSLGLSEVQWLRIDATNSRALGEDAREDYHPIQLAAYVYDVDSSDPTRENVTVTHGKIVTVTVSLEALLAQLLPKGRKLMMDKQQREEEEGKDHDNLAPGKKKMTAGIGFSPDMSAIDMHAGLHMKSGRKDKKGKHTTRHITIQVGWTIAQIIEAIENLDKLIDDEGRPTKEAAGLLLPDKDRLYAAYDNEKWKIVVGGGNVAARSEHNLEVGKIPLLPDLLGELFDPTTARQAKIHLTLPDKANLASGLKKAFLDGSFVPIAGCALEVPKGDGESELYGASFAASPEIFKRLAQFIPYVGLVIKLASLAEGFVDDPMGTIEGIAYTPEAMYHLVRNLPAIVDDIKSMSFTEIAMSLVMNDATAKQAAMAGRLLAKIKNDPTYQEMKKTGKFRNAHGASAEFLQWMSQQSEDALSEMMKLSQQLEQKGITLDGNTEDVPTGVVNPYIVKIKIQMVKSGYEDYAAAMDRVENATTAEEKKEAQAEVDKKAQALLTSVELWTNAGAKKSTRFEDPRSEDAALPEVEPPAYQPTDIHGMPEATEEQEEQARKLFPRAEEGDSEKILSLERDYLVGKYGHLSTEQLAELLTSGKTMVQGGKGVGDFELEMLEPERPFVRNLFLLRVDPSAEVVKAGEADDMKMTDAELVERWKKDGFKGKGVRPGQDTPINPPKGRGDGGDGASGDDGRGPAGNAGTYEEGGDGSGMDEDHAGLGDAEASIADESFVDEAEFMGEESDEAHGNQEVAGAEEGAAGSAEETPIIDDKHLIRLGPDSMKNLVELDETAGEMTLKEEGKKYWLGIDGTSSTGKKVKVSEINIENTGQHGTADSPKFSFSLHFTLTFDGQVDHTETIHSIYQKKGDTFMEPRGEKLATELREELEVKNGTVVKKAGGDGRVEGAGATFMIQEVRASGEINGRWEVNLWVKIESATESGMLMNADGDWFYAKELIDQEVEIVVPFSEEIAAPGAEP